MTALHRRVAAELARSVPSEIIKFAERLASGSNAIAVLFYGSALRTGRLDELLDLYVLTDDGSTPLVWPAIGFGSDTGGTCDLHAKIATMPMALFVDAAQGLRLDTTIWTRFCQPAALVWARDPDARDLVVRAVAAAVLTAARYAAVLGPPSATAADYWTNLFDQTYKTELRIEAPGRSATIVAHDPGRYAELLSEAWAQVGITHICEGNNLRPYLSPAMARALTGKWRRRKAVGRALNMLRLWKAALTLSDAGSYALWKIERHTGVRIEPTPWRLKHPVLAAPSVMWELSRARRRGLTKPRFGSVATKGEDG